MAGHAGSLDTRPAPSSGGALLDHCKATSAYRFTQCPPSDTVRAVLYSLRSATNQLLPASYAAHATSADYCRAVTGQEAKFNTCPKVTLNASDALFVLPCESDDNPHGYLRSTAKKASQ